MSASWQDFVFPRSACLWDSLDLCVSLGAKPKAEDWQNIPDALEEGGMDGSSKEIGVLSGAGQPLLGTSKDFRFL